MFYLLRVGFDLVKKMLDTGSMSYGIVSFLLKILVAIGDLH